MCCGGSQDFLLEEEWWAALNGRDPMGLTSEQFRAAERGEDVCEIVPSVLLGRPTLRPVNRRVVPHRNYGRDGFVLRSKLPRSVLTGKVTVATKVGPEVVERLAAIALFEDRAKSRVLESLILLGMGVYEALAEANLPVPAGSPTPNLTPELWVASSAMGAAP